MDETADIEAGASGVAFYSAKPNKLSPALKSIHQEYMIVQNEVPLGVTLEGERPEAERYITSRPPLVTKVALVVAKGSMVRSAES